MIFFSYLSLYLRTMIVLCKVSESSLRSLNSDEGWLLTESAMKQKVIPRRLS